MTIKLNRISQKLWIHENILNWNFIAHRIWYIRKKNFDRFGGTSKKIRSDRFFLSNPFYLFHSIQSIAPSIALSSFVKNFEKFIKWNYQNLVSDTCTASVVGSLQTLNSIRYEFWAYGEPQKFLLKIGKYAKKQN